MTDKQYSNIKITPLKNSEVEIEGEISADILQSSHKAATKRLSETLEIPGFRKGKVPESVIKQRIGEYPILEDAAEIALNSEYPNILIDHKINAIGRPEITVTKLALGNPLGFKIKTAIEPQFSIPDYKTIAKKINGKVITNDVADKEVDDAIEEIRKNKAHYDFHQQQKLDWSNHAHPEIKDEDLSPLNDEFAKSIGKFETLDALKKQIRENLVKEKEHKAREQKRIEIMDKIIESIKVDLPEVLVRSELEKMLGQFKDDVTRAGLEFDEYLKQVKKTEEEIKKEWRGSAEKKALYQLILNKIAETEKIEADKDMLEHEVKNLLDMYKDAHPENVRVYVGTMLRNEQVFKFLENTK